jgi:hypothetical protein
MQVCGLEWLWRTMMDPGTKVRRYLESHPVFIGMVLKASVRRLLRSRLPAVRLNPHPRADLEKGLPSD